jgi:hypothetical protein
MTVLPFKASFLNRRITFLALWLSKPEVGSSKMIKEGLPATSTAILNLFFYPPEIPLIRTPPTKLSAHF